MSQIGRWDFERERESWKRRFTCLWYFVKQNPDHSIWEIYKVLEKEAGRGSAIQWRCWQRLLLSEWSMQVLPHVALWAMENPHFLETHFLQCAQENAWYLLLCWVAFLQCLTIKWHVKPMPRKILIPNPNHAPWLPSSVYSCRTVIHPGIHLKDIKIIMMRAHTYWVGKSWGKLQRLGTEVLTKRRVLYLYWLLLSTWYIVLAGLQREIHLRLLLARKFIKTQAFGRSKIRGGRIVVGRWMLEHSPKWFLSGEGKMIIKYQAIFF